MSMPIRRIVPATATRHLRVGIVVSRFNPAVGDALLESALADENPHPQPPPPPPPPPCAGPVMRG